MPNIIFLIRGLDIIGPLWMACDPLIGLAEPAVGLPGLGHANTGQARSVRAAKVGQGGPAPGMQAVQGGPGPGRLRPREAQAQGGGPGAVRSSKSWGSSESPESPEKVPKPDRKFIYRYIYIYIRKLKNIINISQMI